MKRKSTIIWFYVIITCFCFSVIFGMRYLGQLSEERSRSNYNGHSKEQLAKLFEKERKKFSKFGLKQDLQVQLHDGKEVNLKDALKGKVSVFLQYFSGCPLCETDNLTAMSEILEKFDHEDLQIVAVNVNGDDKGLEKMKSYHEKRAKGSSRWWFVNADLPIFNDWAMKNLSFARFKKASTPGPMLVDHDLGIVVVGRNSVMVNKETIALDLDRLKDLKKEDVEAHKAARKKELFTSISDSLNGKELTIPMSKVEEKSKTHIYFAVAAGLLVAVLSGFFMSRKMRA